MLGVSTCFLIKADLHSCQHHFKKQRHGQLKNFLCLDFSKLPLVAEIFEKMSQIKLLEINCAATIT